MLRRFVPRSLRAQITIVLLVLELLILAGAVTAAYSLRASSSATRQLASERLTRMQDAQDMVQHAMQVQFLASSLLTAPSTDSLQQTYAAPRLSLTHPATGRPLEVEAPLPEDFAALLDELRAAPARER